MARTIVWLATSHHPVLLYGALYRYEHPTHQSVCVSFLYSALRHSCQSDYQPCAFLVAAMCTAVVAQFGPRRTRKAIREVAWTKPSHSDQHRSVQRPHDYFALPRCSSLRVAGSTVAAAAPHAPFLRPVEPPAKPPRRDRLRRAPAPTGTRPAATKATQRAVEANATRKTKRRAAMRSCR